MKSAATLLNLSTSLAQTAVSGVQNLMLQLINDEHRYSLQKYFDNEREYQTTTVGGMSLTTTASLNSGATSTTLTSSWQYPTVQQLVTFSDGDQRTVLFTNGSTAISWDGGLSENCTDAISTSGVQDYAIPANISKITSTYIQVGQLRFVPVPIQTRVDWDRVNFLPYTSDIVNYAYIYNGTLRFWPIPSTTGDIIQFNYKARVPDFTFLFQYVSSAWNVWTAGNTPTDYAQGTITPPAVGGINITGVGTAWSSFFPVNTDVTYFSLYLRINPPNGDGIWYPISTFNSDTSLTLATPMQNQASSSSGATYSIGQMPVLQEDFHDILVYGRPLQTYFSSIVENATKYKQFQALYQQGMTLMEDYLGTKQVNVDLEAEPVLSNPNNYPYA